MVNMTRTHRQRESMANFLSSYPDEGLPTLNTNLSIISKKVSPSLWDKYIFMFPAGCDTLQHLAQSLLNLPLCLSQQPVTSLNRGILCVLCHFIYNVLQRSVNYNPWATQLKKGYLHFQKVWGKKTKEQFVTHENNINCKFQCLSTVSLKHSHSHLFIFSSRAASLF